jgi:hypothetical protein
MIQSLHIALGISFLASFGAEVKVASCLMAFRLGRTLLLKIIPLLKVSY